MSAIASDGARGPGATWTSRFGTGPTIALGIVLVIFLIGLLAPLIAPHDPLTTDPFARLEAPSWAHLLGADKDGRDVLTRIMFGARSAFAGMAIALIVMLALGVPWGLVTGYLGGAVDQAGMRLADALLAIPGIVLAIAITGLVGNTLVVAMTAIGVVYAPSIAILLRSSIQPIRQSDYVRVSSSFGTKGFFIAFRHILPNAFAPVLVQVCTLASYALIIQAGLAFLGLGVRPPAPSWGSDLAGAYLNYTSAPLGTIVPGLAVVILAFSIGLVGDGVRRLLRVG